MKRDFARRAVLAASAVAALAQDKCPARPIRPLSASIAGGNIDVRWNGC
jgi:hypothetical protein